jgi:hypothetical protein
MPFDPTTAEPVTAAVEPQFDAESAQPIAEDPQPRSRGAGGEWGSNQFAINEKEFRAATPFGRLKMMLSHPWDKYVASVDQGFKGVEIPRVEAESGTGVEKRAGQVGAAVTNTASGIAGGVVSPGGVVAVTNPATLLYSAPRFIVGGIEHILDTVEGALSGEDNLQETVEKGAGGVLMLAGGRQIAKGAIAKARTPQAEVVVPRTPEQAIEAIRSEAQKVIDPNAKAALEAAAVKISEKAQQGVAFDPQSARAVEPAPTPEITKTPPAKLEAVQNAIKDPDTTIQYNVWDREMIPPGRSRVAQVDLPSPNAPRGGAGDGNWSSTNLELLRELGVDAPDVPEWLPPGRYTLEQVKQAIADGPPTETPAVGLGAASPKEFQPAKEFTTSLKQSVIDQERVARGESPIEPVIKKALGESWDEGLKRVDENQNAADDLLTELRDNPRALTDSDVAVLLQRKVDLNNQFNRAEKNITENIGTPDSLASDRATQIRVQDELVDLESVVGSSATATSRGLNAFKLVAKEDFSLTSMLAKRRASKGGAKLTPEEEAQVREQHTAIEEAQRALDQHEAQLELDDAVSTPTEAEAQITKLEAEVTAAEAAPKPTKKSKEENALAAFKKRTRNRIEELRKRVEAGDFSKPVKRQRAMDEEGSLLQAKLDSVKAEFDAALERDRFDRLNGLQKLKERSLGLYDAARNLMTTGEFSFVLRQGKIAAASHPIMTAKALPKAFQALFSDEVTARAIDLQTKNDPIAAKAIENGVHFAEEGARLSAREETLASKLADKLPVLKNFNQSGRVFLNKLRIDLYKTMAGDAQLTPEQGSALAKYVNEATGRGSLGGLEKSAVELGRVLFAPRYLSSRIQYLTGHSMWGGDLATRRIIAKEYARTLVGLGVYYASLTAAFNALVDDPKKKPVVTLDPRSSDFGKVKMGDTRLDPMAGLSQVIVFGARTGSGEKTNAKGAVIPLRGDVPYGGQKWSDVATTFARSKLHPIPGAVINLFDGTDLAGQPATLQNQAFNMVAPLSYFDIYEALEEQDLPEGVSLSLLALLGEGLQTYKNQKPKKQMGQPAKKP